MSISALFEDLGAPLNNRMWSWGSVREQDKAVFLRVWQDGTIKMKERDGKYFTWLIGTDFADTSLGANERRDHVNLIRAGYSAYLIMCQAEDEGADTRKIKDFDSESVRVGGDLIEYEGQVWIELIKRLPIKYVRPAIGSVVPG